MIYKFLNRSQDILIFKRNKCLELNIGYDKVLCLNNTTKLVNILLKKYKNIRKINI